MTSYEGGHFRYFFVCLGITYWGSDSVSSTPDKCMKLLSSKTWRQLHLGKAWCPGPRWYCDCKTKFKASNGCVVEIKQGDEYFYMHAECPDPEVLDIRALAHQKKYGHLTPAELYANLPVCQPAATSFVTHLENGRARFQSEEIFNTLPKFDWDTIFQFAGMMKPVLME